MSSPSGSRLTGPNEHGEHADQDRQDEDVVGEFESVGALGRAREADAEPGDGEAHRSHPDGAGALGLLHHHRGGRRQDDADDQLGDPGTARAHAEEMHGGGDEQRDCDESHHRGGFTNGRAVHVVKCGDEHARRRHPGVDARVLLLA
jgi:hypothetical protein